MKFQVRALYEYSKIKYSCIIASASNTDAIDASLHQRHIFSVAKLTYSNQAPVAHIVENDHQEMCLLCRY